MNDHSNDITIRTMKKKNIKDANHNNNEVHLYSAFRMFKVILSEKENTHRNAK